MKKVSLILAATALMFSTQMASAQVEAPVWNCTLAFNIKGGGLKLLVGSFKLRGPGEINCVDIAGNVEQLPVWVEMGGAPISFSAGIGRLHLVGLATGVGIAGQPQDLLGTYLVGSIRGSLIVGAGADLALHAAERAVTLNAAVQAIAGFGGNIGLDTMTIDAL